MPEPLQYFAAAEVRESAAGRTLAGVILQEGRAASQRSELFAPGSIAWPADGVAILAEHRGQAVLARAVPVRDTDGSIRIETPATPAILEAYETRKFFSVEFHAIAAVRTKGGVREITRALVDAAALVSSPEYSQATAEIRARSRRKVWL